MSSFYALFLLACAPSVFVCAFHAYANEAVDQPHADVRLVDARGSLSSVGLLQIRTDAGFGSVCGMNQAAADVVCTQMGFDYGVVTDSPCGHYGGSDVCGAQGSPISMKDLVCKGGELDVKECTWEDPDTACADHAQDSIVYCGNADGSDSLQDGALRLISSDGSPSVDGEGRLEMFVSKSWAPVCSEGFTQGSDVVACRQMGFSGAAALQARPSCGTLHGQNTCGTTEPRVSKLACSGEEDTVLGCPFETNEDVFCAAEESVIVRCVGDGDTQGRPMKIAPPQPNNAAGASTFGSA